MKNCKNAYEIVVGLIRESADSVLGGMYEIGYEGSITPLYGQLPNTTMAIIVEESFEDTDSLLKLKRGIEKKLKESSFPEVNISIVHEANFSGTKVCSCA